MKLTQFAELLTAHSDKPFALVLPNSDAVPTWFHITEVAHVQKRFIDCGGKIHHDQTCQLQAFVWSDTDHRLLAGKMAGVLEQAVKRGIVPTEQDLDIEFEYEDRVISQYPVDRFEITDNGVVLFLVLKHTDCLAKEVCLPVLPMLGGRAPVSCCGPACDC